MDKSTMTKERMNKRPKKSRRQQIVVRELNNSEKNIVNFIKAHIDDVANVRSRVADKYNIQSITTVNTKINSKDLQLGVYITPAPRSKRDTSRSNSPKKSHRLS